MMSVEGEVQVDCSIEEAWDLFCRFGDVAQLIPTVQDVVVDGDRVDARVEVKLGALPVSSRVILEVVERKHHACLKARGLSYLGETLTEQMKKDIDGVHAGSVGRLQMHLDLRPGPDGGVTLSYSASVAAEGRLKRIYKAILDTKVPAMMEQFAANIRAALERGEGQPAPEEPEASEPVPEPAIALEPPPKRARAHPPMAAAARSEPQTFARQVLATLLELFEVAVAMSPALGRAHARARQLALRLRRSR